MNPLSSLRDEIDNLKDVVDSLQDEIDNLKNVVDNLQDDMINLEGKLEDAIRDYSEVTSQLYELKDDAKFFDERLDKVESIANEVEPFIDIFRGM